MLKLSIEEIIEKISREETFEAVSNDYSFTIKIDKYVYYACAAVHDGNQFRKELWDNCMHTAYERWFE
jgi:succinate dehydrogenase/fumarate reductase cytochrome b subunit